MKEYVLLPTEENLVETLCNDTISRNKDISSFLKILQAQKNACSIAIDGRWGCGKTFFAKQTKMAINALNPHSDMGEELRAKITCALRDFDNADEKVNNAIAVYYDAWGNDGDAEPIMSLIYEITKQISIDFSLSDISIVRVAGAIVETISGRNVIGIQDALKSEDPFTRFKEQKGVEDKTKEFFSGLLSERADRLVVFIDELDRCKPDYAVLLLEQIKHYIFDDRITFVFSVNLEQLQHTIKHYYGESFDACRYLDRFFDLRIALPPANTEKYYNELGLQSSYMVDVVTRRVIKMFNLELREIEKLVSQIRLSVFDATHDSGKYDFSFSDGSGRYFILTVIVPLLLGLQITNVSKYNDFVSGRDANPLKNLLDIEEDEYILSNMLDTDETFEVEEGKKLVSLDDIIDKVYNAIFVEKYDGRIYRTTIGNYCFSAESKELAIRSASMMTQYAKL